jgi:sporulation protein YlmC with PRC-barrel domain
LPIEKKGEFELAFDKAYESLVISPSYEKAFAATVKIYREAKEKGVEIPKSKVDKVKNTFKKPEEAPES